ncbi:MAG: potassium transporter TrkG [Syntrophales bacterium]|nr:potassium transporter TrkG [Syntrophales bacterium]
MQEWGPRSSSNRLREFLKLPEAILVGSFAGVILLGALLLLLPWSQRTPVTFLDALFTSTSAVCVTGLIVVDTATAFTHFGQMVIMALIQAGGLGIMTFAAIAFQFLGKRLSLKSQALLHGSFFQQDVGVNFRLIFKQILWLTAVTELVGATLLFLALGPRTQQAEALFASAFHAVSAFCNAGFSVYTENCMRPGLNLLFNGTILGLIMLGGLGHMVVHELWQKLTSYRRNRGGGSRTPRLSAHSRVVLLVSLVLIIGGALGLLFFGLTPGETTWGAKIQAAFFQSISARTAGFNTVDVGRLPQASLLLLIILMVIGGSPASCAGGIKTTAFAISLAELRARMRGETEVNLFNRRIPKETLSRVSILIRLAAVWNIFGVFLLLATEAQQPGLGMHHLLFEQISAFGTVGLSTGITDKLSAAGRIWIIATMFVGRLGPLTLAIWFFPAKQVHVLCPEGRIMIG